MNKKLILLFASIATLLSVTATAVERFIKAEEIKTAIAGNTWVGKNLNRNTNFKAYFKPDGSLSFTDDMTPKDKGKWFTKNDKLCIQFEGASEGFFRGFCGEMSVDGDKYVFFRPDGVDPCMTISIVNGNPYNL